jgi:hypothetical protein
MDNDEFEALKLRVARLVGQTAESTEQLLAEVSRREQLAGIEDRRPGTVHAIRPGPGNS